MFGRSMFDRSLIARGLGGRSSGSFHNLPSASGSSGAAGEEQTGDAVQWSNADDVLWSDGTTMEFT